MDDRRRRFWSALVRGMESLTLYPPRRRYLVTIEEFARARVMDHLKLAADWQRVIGDFERAAERERRAYERRRDAAAAESDLSGVTPTPGCASNVVA